MTSQYTYIVFPPVSKRLRTEPDQTDPAPLLAGAGSLSSCVKMCIFHDRRGAVA